MKRSRLILMLSLLALSGLGFLGCGGDPGKVGEVAAPRPAAGPADLDLDDLTYEVITGTLTPGAGGAMGQYLTTWDKNCWVALIVPQTAMDPDGDPINWTMRIPTKASYLAHQTELHQRLIVRLEPDGQGFPDSITVQATWMPWQGAPPDTLYYWSGYGERQAEVQYLPSVNRYRITMKLTHFSDWEVGPEPPRAPPE